MDTVARLTETWIVLDDASGVGAARRAALACATAAGADEARRATFGLIVTELATNCVRHAGKGALLIQPVATATAMLLEVQAIDSGPGIADPAHCLRDGYSTAGTPGTGLGAVRRLADDFDFHTDTRGTAVLARLASTKRSGVAAAEQAIAWGCTARPAPRETCNGDAWAVFARPDGVQAIVADGLGHGPRAAEASQLAVEVFGETGEADLVRAVERMHAALGHTRGAALAACRLTTTTRSLGYLGIGNIAGTLIAGSGDARGLFTQHGTVGQVCPRLQPQHYDCPARGLLVMHSDGIRSQWKLDAYPGLAQRHPALVAAILTRDFRRGTDDSTVLVIAFDQTASG